MSPRLTFSIITIVFLWASSFVAIKVALQDISPINLSLARFIISSIVLIVPVCFRRLEVVSKKDFIRFVVAGIFGVTIYNLALNFGQQTVSAGSASFLINTVPVFTTVMAFVFLKEQPSLRTIIGILVSMAGIGVITFSESQDIEFNFGILLVLAAAFSQAIFFITQKPLLKRYDPLTVISYSVWLGTLFLLPFSFDILQLEHARLPAILSVIFLGVFPGALGLVIWSYVLSKMKASKATSFLYFVPVISVILSFFLVEEVPSLLMTIGGIGAITGVYIVNLKKSVR